MSQETEMANETVAMGGKIPCFAFGQAHSISTTSSAAAKSTKEICAKSTCIWLWATVDVYLDIGANPTAASTTNAWPAYTPVAIKVKPGDFVSAKNITAATGAVYFTESGKM